MLRMVPLPRVAGEDVRSSPTYLQPIGDFDQIPVRVADIDRDQRARRALALDRPDFDRDAAATEMLDHLRHRSFGDETEVAGAGRRLLGLGLELMAGAVKVDLLVAEAQRLAPLAERLDRQAEHGRIEGASALDIGDCQNEMVEALDDDHRAASALNRSSSRAKSARAACTSPPSGPYGRGFGFQA